MSQGQLKKLSLIEFLEAENEILRKSEEFFSDEIKVFDMVGVVKESISDSIKDKKIKGDKDSAAILLSLFHISHVYSRLAFVLSMRGHYLESLSLLRPSLEMASHLYNIGKSPASHAKIWLKQREKGYKNQYEKIFDKQLFADNLDCLKSLKNIYHRACCDYSSHATELSLTYKVKIQKGDGIRDIYFYDFDADYPRTRLHLILVLHCIQQILEIIKISFENIFDKTGFEPIKVGAKLTQDEIQKLKEKYNKWRKYLDEYLKTQKVSK